MYYFWGTLLIIFFSIVLAVLLRHKCNRSKITNIVETKPVIEHSSKDKLTAERPTAQILFLDFDGVLQTPALDDWQEMELCDELIAILEEFPHLSIVVSSTHREGRNLAGVRRLLPDKIAQRVIGFTPVTPRGRAAGGRQTEIELWLAAHPEKVVFAAVDDETHLFQADCDWLVPTHPLIGWNFDTTYYLRLKLNHYTL